MEAAVWSSFGGTSSGIVAAVNAPNTPGLVEIIC